MRLYRAQGWKGAVASAHPFASWTGLSVLARGGDAVDAAIAVNAVLNVCQPDACGIGGDLFALCYRARDGTVYALNASGRSPAGARREDLAARFPRIPPRSAYAVTVPGCVQGWRALHERFGRVGWADLFADAVAVAEEGFPLTERLAEALQAMWAEAWSEDRVAAAVFYQQEPKAGACLRLPELAETFRRIAAEGAEGFYRGPLARKIAERVSALGHPLTVEDLEACEAEWAEPLSASYRGYEVVTTRPNSQGFVALLTLGLLAEEEPRRFSGPRDPAWIDTVLNAAKAAYRLRDRILTDPQAMAPDVLERALAQPELLRREEGPAPDLDPAGDTTAFSVADQEGNVVSVIQSLFHPFGSGVLVPGTGILLQNRGAYFRLEPGHPNSFAPRKRTAHTLMATLVVRGGRPCLSFSTMGGDGQPQTTVQVLTHHLDFQLSLEEALAEPRWVYGARRYEGKLGLERRFAPHVAASLAARGHDLVLLRDWAHETGHAQAIACAPDGLYTAAADPRGDGLALCR